MCNSWERERARSYVSVYQHVPRRPDHDPTFLLARVSIAKAKAGRRTRVSVFFSLCKTRKTDASPTRWRVQRQRDHRVIRLKRNTNDSTGIYGFHVGVVRRAVAPRLLPPREIRGFKAHTIEESVKIFPKGRSVTFRDSGMKNKVVMRSTNNRRKLFEE